MTDVQPDGQLDTERNMLRPEMNRRAFLLKSSEAVAAVAVAGAITTMLPRRALAAPSLRASRHAAMHARMNSSMGGINMPVTQDQTQKPGVTAGVVDMEGDYYKPVRKAPRPNAVAQLNAKQIEELERTIACPCPCTLDVFTCRTTDFACGNSPAVHRDIVRLVEGGYSGKEIMDALVGTYGNFILTAPPKTGFNLVGWYAPFAALGVGAVVISLLLRTWRRNATNAAAAAASNAGLHMPDVGATPEEMARLRAALRDDSR